MKKILSKISSGARALFAMFVIACPFMALKGGGQSPIELNEYALETERLNDSMRSEIKAINDTISIIDIQIRYKDSIDNLSAK